MLIICVVELYVRFVRALIDVAVIFLVCFKICCRLLRNLCSIVFRYPARYCVLTVIYGNFVPNINGACELVEKV